MSLSVYMYVYRVLVQLGLDSLINIYVYMYVCMYVCMYTYEWLGSCNPCSSNSDDVVLFDLGQ